MRVYPYSVNTGRVDCTLVTLRVLFDPLVSKRSFEDFMYDCAVFSTHALACGDSNLYEEKCDRISVVPVPGARQLVRPN